MGNFLMCEWIKYRKEPLFVGLLLAFLASQAVMTEACQTLIILMIISSYLKSLQNDKWLVLTGISIGCGFLLRDETGIFLVIVLVFESMRRSSSGSQLVMHH